MEGGRRGECSLSTVSILPRAVIHTIESWSQDRDMPDHHCYDRSTGSSAERHRSTATDANLAKSRWEFIE
jgi:hypothetical protein